jgi:hypothetical protein
MLLIINNQSPARQMTITTCILNQTHPQMKAELFNGFCALHCIAALTVFPVTALAALGQPHTDNSSCPSSALCANPWSGRLSDSGLFSIFEKSLETGTVIKEYSRPDGLVFAVSWRGPVQPDLAPLLGAYFTSFKQVSDEARLSGRRGSPLTMASNGLVVSASGRMPHFFGFAYVTHLLPSGINIKDVVQ